MPSGKEDWRGQILQAFVPQVAPLTLVADPDGLLLEEKLTEGIRVRGSEILDNMSPLRFVVAEAGKQHAEGSAAAIRGDARLGR